MEPRISMITLGVDDMPRAIRFYRDGLGFDTSATDDAEVAFFRTDGARLSLYPRERLAADVSPELSPERSGFSATTLAHVARSREEVDAILDRAKQAGGTVLKPAQEVFWGGYSGYFTDPDGHLWEVASWEGWEFNPDGSLVIE